MRTEEEAAQGLGGAWEEGRGREGKHDEHEETDSGGNRKLSHALICEKLKPFTCPKSEKSKHLHQI